MNIAKSIPSAVDFLATMRAGGRSIGLVPTMGYLHEGHVALVRRARDENDFVVVSIFVNPVQFGEGEDFSEYPRDEKRDLKTLAEEGVDLLFSPSENEIFKNHKTFVQVEEMVGKLCDITRPGHFRGVATVVLKLINIVEPESVYFGEKDFQQYVMVKKMVRDLNLGTAVKGVETVREADGLALSSRNVYLSESERSLASFIPRALRAAREMVLMGERRSAVIEKRVSTLLTEKHFEVEYVHICSSENLERDFEVKNGSRIFLALRLGNTRLIDNQLLCSKLAK